ncbi:outer membrane beta-barrel family protein [Pedobacter sp.]|uniref:outer membrane beta-barrel family protein n=1 Tax=Pedobacter sp. TaxID=1411316 RepID=UPI00396CB04B
MNTYTVRVLVIALSMLFCMNGFAQSISGLIKDETGLPLENVTIRLLTTDSALVKLEISNKEGRYTFGQLNPGSFIVKISSTGYLPAYSTVFKFEGRDMTIPEIILHKTVQELKGVTITASKPVLERKIDRLVFNLENSLATGGMTFVDALSITPMLNVSERNISMIGKGELKVMINDRIVPLKGTDLIAYLRALRADDIAKIEIITIPPSKYAAEGNSGLVNIVLKKNTQIGWSGTVSTSYLQNKRTALMNGLTLNYQTQRLNSSLKLRETNKRGIITESENLIGNSTEILNSYPRSTRLFNIGGNLSMDYKVDKRNSVGFIYDLNSTGSRTDMDAISIYKTGQLINSTVYTTSQAKNATLSNTLNIYHDLKLDSLGKTVSTSLNYFSNRPETKSDLLTTSSDPSEDSHVKNNRANHYNIWSLQSDMTLPYKWAKLNLGSMFMNYRNSADVGFYNFSNGGYEIDPSKSNLFEYREQNVAAYFDLEKKLNKQWSAKLGLRYEYSYIDGFSPADQVRNRYAYGQFFPTAYIMYKANSLHTFSASYSKRITRPSLNQVNPFKFYITTNSYISGNPDIRPSYSHNTELSYLYKSALSITLFSQQTVNGAGNIVTLKDNIISSAPANYLKNNSFGIYATLNSKIAKWWENTTFITLSYSKSKSSVPEIVIRDGSTFNYGTNNTMVITKRLRYTLNFSGTPASTRGNTYTFSQYNLSTGLRATFLENKLTVNASYLNSSKDKSRGFYNNLTSIAVTDYNYSTFNLTAVLMIGQSKVKGNNKKVNFSGSQRASN